MHLPKLYKSENLDLLREIIKENAFASLIIHKDRILATKAMMQIHELENNHFFIETHVSRADPLARKIEQGDEALCDFLGAHTYISSSWYDHINVSTWNYEQVQIYGVVEIMTDNELFEHLNKLTNFFESPQQCPVTFKEMGREFVEKEMKGALGIKIIPTEVKIKQKLSQNRDDVNYERIIENLNTSDAPMDKIIAKKMKDLR
jgi:transcriptional regulator